MPSIEMKFPPQVLVSEGARFLKNKIPGKVKTWAVNISSTHCHQASKTHFVS